MWQIQKFCFWEISRFSLNIFYLKLVESVDAEPADTEELLTADQQNTTLPEKIFNIFHPNHLFYR